MKPMNKILRDNSDDKQLKEDDEFQHDEESDEVDDGDDFVYQKDTVAKIPVLIAKPALDEGNNNILSKRTKQNSTAAMVVEAINELKEKGGSSLEAIRKFIMAKNPDMVANRLKSHIKRYIKKSISDGTIVQIKRSFKLTNKDKLTSKAMEKQKRLMEKKKQSEKLKQEKGQEKTGNGEEVTLKKNTKRQELNDAHKNKIEVVTRPARKNQNHEIKVMLPPSVKLKGIDGGIKSGVTSETKNTTEKSNNIAESAASKKDKKMGKQTIKNKKHTNLFNLALKATPPRVKTLQNDATKAVATKKNPVLAESVQTKRKVNKN